MSIDQRVQTGAGKLDQGSARRVGSVLIGIAVLALKAEASAHFLSDGRVFVLVILGLTAVSGVRLFRGTVPRSRPVA